jgi:recombination associated protein RdgC
VSLFRGSLTYVRFFVEGELPDDFLDDALALVKKKIQRPLEADDDENERAGWCKVGEPFVLEIEHEDMVANEYVNLGYRTDKWAIPGALLKAKLAEAEATYLQKKGRERLSKKEKTELKELVARKLRKTMTPVVRAQDVSWALNEGTVRFFGTSPRTQLAFSELFYKTFGLKLVPESPYTLASRLGMSKSQESEWQSDDPLAFSAEEA